MQLINPEVRIETTNLCNARCMICPREKMTRKQVTMGYEHFKDLVDQAKKLGANLISPFGYGEPLLDPTICEKIEYCTSRRLDTFITTNASMLDGDMAFDLLKAGLTKIRFSVHGKHDLYNKVHQKLNYKDVIAKINDFVVMSQVRFKDKCEYHVSVIPMNDESIDDIKADWPENLFKLEIWKPHNWTDGKNYRQITDKRKKTCGRPARGPVQINADGKMIVCCFDFDGKLVVGNTYKNTIEEILKGSNFKFIRKRHETGNVKGLICETCDQLNEGDTSLLYSTLDPSCGINKTSSAKFSLNE